MFSVPDFSYLGQTAESQHPHWTEIGSVSIACSAGANDAAKQHEGWSGKDAGVAAQVRREQYKVGGSAFFEGGKAEERPSAGRRGGKRDPRFKAVPDERFYFAGDGPVGQHVGAREDGDARAGRLGKERAVVVVAVVGELPASLIVAGRNHRELLGHGEGRGRPGEPSPCHFREQRRVERVAVFDAIDASGDAGGGSIASAVDGDPAASGVHRFDGRAERGLVVVPPGTTRLPSALSKRGQSATAPHPGRTGARMGGRGGGRRDCVGPFGDGLVRTLRREEARRRLDGEAWTPAGPDPFERFRAR